MQLHEENDRSITGETILSSWKSSRWFPAKTSVCCTALAFVCFIPWAIFCIDLLTDSGFRGGTAGLGLVLFYMPVLVIGFLGFMFSGIALFVIRKKSEKKIATVSFCLSSVLLLPAVVILFYILQVILGLR